MTDSSAPALERQPLPPTRLEPDAIGATQDTLIGMANSAPAVSIGLTLALLASATAYGSGPVILLTAVPMLVIANAYRRLNLWNANCGASFEWVGRSINPYLGWMTGWLMIMGQLIGTLSGVVVLAPSILAIFGSNGNSVAPNIIIATIVTLVMLTIAVIGIKITARTQVGFAAIEYTILIGFAVAVLIFALGHHANTFAPSRGWLSLSGIHGAGSASAGFLLAVFMYTGWDGTVYVNEEVKHRRVNPGRAAMLAVVFLALIYTFCTVGLQGGLSPKNLQNNAAAPLTAIAQNIGGGSWAKVMAFALALSVIASTGTGIVLVARMLYGMASHRVLPEFFASVHRRFSTPVTATLVVGAVLLVLTWVYLLTTTVQNAFYDVIDETGLLYALFYILTALATIVYYRRRVVASFWDFIILGVLPIGGAGFLGWIIYKSVQSAPRAQNLSMLAIIVVGLVLMVMARLVLRSSFFSIRRESFQPRGN